MLQVHDREKETFRETAESKNCYQGTNKPTDTNCEWKINSVKMRQRINEEIP